VERGERRKGRVQTFGLVAIGEGREHREGERPVRRKEERVGAAE